jgi:hypothetical protein
MSEEVDTQWRELVLSGQAEWAPGMLAMTRWRVRVGRVVSRIRFGGVRLCGGGNVGWGCVPHWDDPATRGALLGQVRERYSDPTIYARPDDDGQGWTLYNALGPVDPRGIARTAAHEVGALLRGLELAP